MRISYYVLSQMAKCPKQYELDLSQEVSTTSAPLFLGSTFHLIQKLYFSTRIAGTELSLPDLLDAFNTYWTAETGADGRPIMWEKNKPDEQAELGRALIKAYYPYTQRIQPLLIEHKLTKDVGGHTVSGIIDLLTTSGSVVDYKTSAWIPYKTDIEREYQPTVYSFLLGGSVDFQYHYIIKQKLPVVRIFPTKRNGKDLQFFEKVLLPNVIRMIQSGVFPPLGVVTGQCQRCSYKCNE